MPWTVRTWKRRGRRPVAPSGRRSSDIAPAISKEIALAAVPIAGDMADDAVEVAAELIESADDVVDAITDDVPGGGVVNQMWDVVLMPGRLGIRVATTVLKRGES